MKEKPKKIKVESRTSRTERSSFRERRSKEEQFDKPRSNRGDRKERKPKKYDEKPKEVSLLNHYWQIMDQILDNSQKSLTETIKKLETEKLKTKIKVSADVTFL